MVWYEYLVALIELIFGTYAIVGALPGAIKSGNVAYEWVTK